MPIIEYMLLALLGTAGAAAPGGIPSRLSTRTLDVDVVTQPKGGTAGLPGQDTGGDKDKQAGTGRRDRSHLKARRHQRSSITLNPQPLPPRKIPHLEARRHHRRGHRHTKVTGAGFPKVSSSTPGTGGVKPNMNAQPRPPRPRRAPSHSNKNSK